MYQGVRPAQRGALGATSMVPIACVCRRAMCLWVSPTVGGLLVRVGAPYRIGAVVCGENAFTL